MRRNLVPVAVLTAVLTAVLGPLLMAGPAVAGGPTSVLLAAPATGATASAYNGEADYQALADLVGAFAPDGVGGTVDDSPAGHEEGPVLTVTWLVHDVTVWRVDRIFLDAPGGPWIASHVSAGGLENGIWDTPPVWQSPRDPEALVALLDRLGMLGAAARSLGTTDAAAAPRHTDTSSWDGLGWGAAGLLLGAATTQLAGRLRRRAQADRTEVVPPPEPLDLPGESLAHAEVLSWPPRS